MRNRLLISLIFALSLGTGAFAADKSGDANAPKYPEIKLTKIQEFDPTLSKAKDIHTTLEGIENKLHDANKGLAATLSLPETTSIDDALAELQKRANNKIKVAMKGKVPKLEASDAVPEEVQKGIDTVNGLTDDLGASLEQIQGMPAEVTQLINDVKGFPTQLNLDLIKKNNLQPTELPKITKTLGVDLKAVEATPERIQGVTDQTLGLFTKVQKAFPG